MKKGIRYLRFSHDGQSNSSIERQELYTGQWFDRNNVQLIDTFTDAGYSAKTFDRPDFNKLKDFIEQHHRQVDYLVVDQLDRFSRDAGEALSMVKKLQLKYSIQIVSATEGITFDYHTPGSFFRAGLQFLLAEDDNINRTQKINAGIYTAKAKEGRYIHGKPPFGYDIAGKGKARHLVVNEEQASVIRYIYDAFLRNTPDYIIHQQAKQLGFKATGNSAIKDVLCNPIYSGQQYVKPWKDLPGGIFPANHKAIIDLVTWQQVQERMNPVPQKKATVSDALPLRGVLHCHCSKLLTGAPSRNGVGNYYYYYKCHTSGHNTISATKAHDQLNQMLGYMSLPSFLVQALKEKSESILDDRQRENKKQLQKVRHELEEAEKDLLSLEAKWLKNQCSFEMYNRWYADLTQKRISLKAQIERLSQDMNEVYFLMQEELIQLTDLQYIYGTFPTLDKQEFLRMVFDNRLYYRDNIYRTHYLMDIFHHNLLILKEKQLLELDGKEKTGHEVRSGGGDRSIIEPVTDLLTFIRMKRVA